MVDDETASTRLDWWKGFHVIDHPKRRGNQMQPGHRRYEPWFILVESGEQWLMAVAPVGSDTHRPKRMAYNLANNG